MADDFEFGITFRTEDRLDARTVAEMLRDIEEMLLDIETRLTDHGAVAHWKWAEENTLRLAISSNGITSDVLQNIIDEGYAGFQAAGNPAQTIEWPPAFGPIARQSVTNILRHLESMESIVVEATGRPLLEITETSLPGVTSRKTVRRVWSSVDGIVELMASRGSTSRAGIREHATGRYIRCYFSGTEWDERIQSLWKQRVLVEGRVAYNSEGQATSITDITSIEPRATVNIKDLRGSVPELTYGRTPEDHIARVRGDG